MGADTKELNAKTEESLDPNQFVLNNGILVCLAKCSLNIMDADSEYKILTPRIAGDTHYEDYVSVFKRLYVEKKKSDSSTLFIETVDDETKEAISYTAMYLGAVGVYVFVVDKDLKLKTTIIGSNVILMAFASLMGSTEKHTSMSIELTDISSKICDDDKLAFFNLVKTMLEESRKKNEEEELKEENKSNGQD